MGTRSKSPSVAKVGTRTNNNMLIVMNNTELKVTLFLDQSQLDGACDVEDSEMEDSEEELILERLEVRPGTGVVRGKGENGVADGK